MPTQTEKDPNIIPVRGRLSYPHLFEAKAVQKGQDAKFSCTFLMDKKIDAASIKRIEDRIKVLLSEPPLKGHKLQADKICLKDGALKDGVDGYGDKVMFVSASSDNRPHVVDQNKVPVVAQDNKPVAGNLVDGTIRLWAQSNEYGKRVNAELRTVRFLKDDGVHFGSGTPVNAEDELPDVDTVEV